jgi:FemAB-related protein (PEP-CTERM system-associated)
MAIGGLIVYLNIRSCHLWEIRPRRSIRNTNNMIEIDLDTEQTEWDGYTATHSSSCFAHLFAWGEALASTYGLRILRLGARDKNNCRKLVGILPLILFPPPGGKVRLISLPYTDAAGIVANDEEIASRLLSVALDLAAELGALHLELRQADGGRLVWNLSADMPGLWRHTPHSFKTGLLFPLPDSTDNLWTGLAAKVRNQVRKARKCGCRAEIGGAELLVDFFAVFSENMRDLGSPVHALELFQRVAKGLENRTRIIVIYVDGTPVAAAMVFQHASTLYNPWASSLRSFRPFCPNMLLYWTMLRYGVDHGCSWFDFGRSSPGAPTCRFKLQWGAVMQPLVWHVFSFKPFDWDPTEESLIEDTWKMLDLEKSRRRGPSIRRWISL